MTPSQRIRRVLHAVHNAETYLGDLKVKPRSLDAVAHARKKLRDAWQSVHEAVVFTEDLSLTQGANKHGRG